MMVFGYPIQMLMALQARGEPLPEPFVRDAARVTGGPPSHANDIPGLDDVIAARRFAVPAPALPRSGGYQRPVPVVRMPQRPVHDARGNVIVPGVRIVYAGTGALKRGRVLRLRERSHDGGKRFFLEVHARDAAGHVVRLRHPLMIEVLR